MRPEAKVQRRGDRSAPARSLRRGGSLPLSTRWRGERKTISDTINPKNYLSVKAG